jgi:hypothetical protein
MPRDAAKECALIFVNESLLICNPFASDYWLEVKKEIELL